MYNNISKQVYKTQNLLNIKINYLIIHIINIFMKN